MMTSTNISAEDIRLIDLLHQSSTRYRDVDDESETTTKPQPKMSHRGSKKKKKTSFRSVVRGINYYAIFASFYM